MSILVLTLMHCLILTLRCQWDLKCQQMSCFSVSLHAARPPKITAHPEESKDAVPGETLAFTIQASGTEPLNYQWEIKTTCQMALLVTAGRLTIRRCHRYKAPTVVQNCSSFAIVSRNETFDGPNLAAYQCHIHQDTHCALRRKDTV